MGMLKKGSSSTAIAPVTEAAIIAAPIATTTPDSGTAAAVSRLQKKAETSSVGKASTGRDFAEEARGKTRCVQFEAALMSPAIAGMSWKSMKEYLEYCKEAADYGTAYTFGEFEAKK